MTAREKMAEGAASHSLRSQGHLYIYDARVYTRSIHGCTRLLNFLSYFTVFVMFLVRERYTR